MRTGAFEALSDEKRLTILELLAGGERCVCEVSEALGISNALASHHLKRLREAGLVSTRRKGLWLHCRLEEGALLGLADQLRELASRAVQATGCCCGTEREGDDDD